MPITMQYEPSAAALGLAGYASGYNATMRDRTRAALEIDAQQRALRAQASQQSAQISASMRLAEMQEDRQRLLQENSQKFQAEQNAADAERQAARDELTQQQAIERERIQAQLRIDADKAAEQRQFDMEQKVYSIADKRRLAQWDRAEATLKENLATNRINETQFNDGMNQVYAGRAGIVPRKEMSKEEKWDAMGMGVGDEWTDPVTGDQKSRGGDYVPKVISKKKEDPSAFDVDSSIKIAAAADASLASDIEEKIVDPTEPGYSREAELAKRTRSLAAQVQAMVATSKPATGEAAPGSMSVDGMPVTTQGGKFTYGGDSVQALYKNMPGLEKIIPPAKLAAVPARDQAVISEAIRRGQDPAVIAQRIDALTKPKAKAPTQKPAAPAGPSLSDQGELVYDAATGTFKKAKKSVVDWMFAKRQ